MDHLQVLRTRIIFSKKTSLSIELSTMDEITVSQKKEHLLFYMFITSHANRCRTEWIKYLTKLWEEGHAGDFY